MSGKGPSEKQADGVNLQRRALVASSLAALPLLAGGAVLASSPRLPVLVVGAGLSGLHAASLLEQAGVPVRLLEASQRIGGRLHTLERDGLRFDVGGVEIGTGYQRVRAVAERLGVELHAPERGPPPIPAVFIQGRALPFEDWAEHAANPLGGEHRATPAPLLLMRALASDDSLPRANQWLEPEFAALDRPLAAHLAERGYSRAAIALMDVTANFNALDRVSALDVLRRDLLRREGGQGTLWVRGGSQRLPEAMAQALRHTEVEFGKLVQAVDDDGSQVTVRLADGGVVHGSHLLLTLPAPLLPKLHYSPALPEAQASSFAQREATAISSVHFRPLSAWWESDGLPLGMWVDDSIERVFAVAGDGPGGVERIIVWINGDRARQLDALDGEALGQWVEWTLASLRPASRGQMQRLAVRSWGADPLAAGAYAEIAAGHCASTAAWAMRAHGRVHFAGEHCDFAHSGMEAALASAESAVKAIVGSLS